MFLIVNRRMVWDPMRLGNRIYWVLVGWLRHTACAYYFCSFSPHDGFLPVSSSRYFAVRFTSALSFLFDFCLAESSAAYVTR